MREIKFRGKTIATGEWIDGSYVYAHKWFGTGEAGHFIYDIYGDSRVLVDGDTLGQYTGLHDKNDKEIYEGDLVKVKELKEDALIVKWDEKRGAFFLKNAFSNWWWFTYMGDYDVEVIGNIYENPELLEVKSEKD